MSNTVEEIDTDLITDVAVDGIDHKDYPDYCDAYISFALYEGKEMTEEQINAIPDDYRYDVVYSRAVGA